VHNYDTIKHLFAQNAGRDICIDSNTLTRVLFEGDIL
jgi:hypothetical protein